MAKRSVLASAAKRTGSGSGAGSFASQPSNRGSRADGAPTCTVAASRPCSGTQISSVQASQSASADIARVSPGFAPAGRVNGTSRA